VPEGPAFASFSAAAEGRVPVGQRAGWPTARLVQPTDAGAAPLG
jgi:hypothetical protein